MRRDLVALSIVTLLILAAVFILARLTSQPMHETVFLRQVEVAGDLALTSLAPSAREDRGAELATPLDPSAELWSRRSEARPEQAADSSPKTFTVRRTGGGRASAAMDVEIRDHTISWCAIVGIAEEKRHDVADLVVRTQRKWLSLCRVAGTAQSVNALELAGLREWRREELGRIVGFEAGDALIAGIKTKQGF